MSDCPWCGMSADMDDEFNCSQFEGETWHDSCIEECEEQREVDGDE